MIHLKNNNQIGISFIEILVGLFLFSILMSFSIPRFMNMQQGQAKKRFSADFSMLIADGMRQAIVTQRVHQIFWDFKNHTITLKTFDETIETTNKHEKFKPATAEVSKSVINIPEHFSFLNFFINGKDDVTSSSALATIFTYIMPDGTSQPVLINIQDEDQTNNNRFHIRINPFYSQVSINNGFAQP